MNIFRKLKMAAQGIFAGSDPDLAGKDHALGMEKRVTFYPTYGKLSADRSMWIIPMRIWVTERSDRIRQLAASYGREVLQKQAELETITEHQAAIFRQRIEPFIADGESREEVVFVFEGDPELERFSITWPEGGDKTDFNGLIIGELQLPVATADRLLTAQSSTQGWLTFRAVSENHGGIGELRLIAPEGLSVISDVDDTVKVTDIPLGIHKVLRKTFFEPFEATPCMPEIYRSFETETAFHYVTGSPSQLYWPIEEFMFSEAADYPMGSFHMKNVRTNLFEDETYQDWWRLLSEGSGGATKAQKTEQIRQILEDFPGRQFVLIGDSGEHDPEIFKDIQAAFPEQVIRIMIRDVAKERLDKPERFAGIDVIPPQKGSESNCRSFVERFGQASLLHRSPKGGEQTGSSVK